LWERLLAATENTVDEIIYTGVINSLRIFPEQQCHIIETLQALKPQDEPLDITLAFDLIKNATYRSLLL